MPDINALCAPSAFAKNAARCRLVSIEKKYLLEREHLPVPVIIQHWLSNSSLSIEEQRYLCLALDSFDQTPETIGETPMRNFLASTILALDDMPGPSAERYLRFRAFDHIHQEMIDTVPALKADSVRMLWAQALDGHDGYFLPLNEQDCILKTLRAQVTNILQVKFGCIFLDDQELDDSQRIAFDQSFRTVILPWLLCNRMHEAVLEAILQQDIKTPIAMELSRLGIQADERIDQWITADALRAMPCDFTPFLATLHTWLQQHASFFILRSAAAPQNPAEAPLFAEPAVPVPELTPKDQAALNIIEWLFGDFSVLPASDSRARDDIALFYQLVYAFDQLNIYHALRTENIQAVLPPGLIKNRYVAACRVLEQIDFSLLPAMILSGQFPGDLMTSLKHFEAGYLQWRKLSHHDFISAFFRLWNEGTYPENIQTRSKLFIELSRLYFLEKPEDGSQGIPLIRVTDSNIPKWLSTTKPTGYQLNRMLLHALCYPPMFWSATFFQGLKYLIYLHLIRPYASRTQLIQFHALCDVYQGKTPLSPLNDRNMPCWVAAPELVFPKLSVLTNQYLLITPGLEDAFLARLMDPASGFDPLQVNDNNDNLLISWASWGQIKQFTRLLDSGCNPDHTNAQGVSALHAAVNNDNQAIIDVLIARHANLDLEDEDGETPLMIALKNKNTVVAEKLLKAGAVCNLLDLEQHPGLLAQHNRFFTPAASSSQTKGSRAENEGIKFQRNW